MIRNRRGAAGVAAAALTAGLGLGACTVQLPAAPAPAPAPPVVVPTPEEQQAPSTTTPRSTSGCVGHYQTSKTTVNMCYGGDGKLYYSGTDATTGNSIALPATAIGNGTYQSVPNDGYRYTINSTHLVVTRNGSTVSDQTVTNQSLPGGSSSGSSSQTTDPYSDKTYVPGYGYREKTSGQRQQEYGCQQGYVPQSQC
jgi:hypothetical protein